MTRVFVVGGYGAVGLALAGQLQLAGFDVLAGGRRPEPGRKIVEARGLTWRHIDLGVRAGWSEALTDVDVVVVSVEQRNADFAKFVVGQGKVYADLSAEDAHLAALENLAVPSVGAGLISIGFAPGLSSMMAAELLADFDEPGSANIGLLFGLNDHHGEAAMEWTAQAILSNARPRKSLVLDWAGRWGRRRMHWTAFGDQFSLVRTRHAASAQTFVGFDSRPMTALAFSLAGWLPANAGVVSLAKRAFMPVGLGSRVCGILVEAHGTKSGIQQTRKLRFLAEEETRTTARLAALMIGQFLAEGHRGKIWHAYEVLHRATLLRSVVSAGAGEIVADPIAAS